MLATTFPWRANLLLAAAYLLLSLLVSLLAVLIIELLNSALETLADAVSVEHHPLLGRAKDIGSAAVLLTLADADTNVWLDAAAGTPELAAHLAFHCGCPRVLQPEEARFAVIADPAAMPPLSAFDQGTASYPDRSATLIIEVAALEGGVPWTLAGPGIKDRTIFAPQGLPEAFPGWLADNRARFPMGVDLLFTCAGRLAALARTTRLED